MNFKKCLATLVAIAGTTALVLHFINKLITLSATKRNYVSNHNGHYYKWRFGDVFYTKEGSGSPILLIHDLETYSSSYEWYKIRRELAKTHTVYAIDLLGCGRSDKPNITYTNFLYVQLVTNFIESVIESKTDIISSGSSCAITIMSSVYNKELIDKIILINPNDLNELSKVPNKYDKFIKKVIATPILGTFFYNICNSKTNIENKFITNFYLNPDLVLKNEVSLSYETAHLGGANAKYLFASIYSNYTNTNIAHALHSLNNEIYILASDGSPNYLTFAEQYQHHTPSIEVFNIKNTMKYPQLEAPQDILNQIKFLFDN